eukprot:403342185
MELKSNMRDEYKAIQSQIRENQRVLELKRLAKPEYEIEEENRMLLNSALQTRDRQNNALNHQNNTIFGNDRQMEQGMISEQQQVQNKALQDLQQQLSYYIFTNQTPELKQYNTAKNQLSQALTNLDEEIEKQEKDFVTNIIHQNKFEMVDFQQEAVKRAEEQRIKSEIERQNNFKSKVFGGIIQKMQTFNEKTQDQGKKIDSFDDINFEEASILDIFKFKKDIKITSQTENQQKITSYKQPKVFNQEDQELLKVLFSDELVSTQLIDYSQKFNNSELPSRHNKDEEESEEIIEHNQSDQKKKDKKQIEHLSDIHLDLGVQTREIAPLKHNKFDDQILSDQMRVNLELSNDDEGLTGPHFFHHILGLSNLKKIMKDRIEDLGMSTFTTNLNDTQQNENSSQAGNPYDSVMQLQQQYDFQRITDIADRKKSNELIKKLKNPQKLSLKQNAGTDSDDAEDEEVDVNEYMRLRYKLGATGGRRSDRRASKETVSDSEEYGEEKNDEILPLKQSEKQTSFRKSQTQRAELSNKNREKPGSNEFIQQNNQGSMPDPNVLSDNSPTKQSRGIKGGMNDALNNKFQARRQEMDQFLNKRMNNFNSDQVKLPSQSPGLVQQASSNSQTRTNKSGTQTNKGRQQSGDQKPGLNMQNYDTFQIQQYINKSQVPNQSQGQPNEFIQQLMEQAKGEQLIIQNKQEAQYIQQVDQIMQNISSISQILSTQNSKSPMRQKVQFELQKRLEQQITELFLQLSQNQEKVIPLPILIKCFQLQDSEFNEQLKAKVLTQLVREYRKNREANKQYQQHQQFGMKQAQNSNQQRNNQGQTMNNQQAMHQPQKSITSKFDSKESSQKQLMNQQQPINIKSKSSNYNVKLNSNKKIYPQSDKLRGMKKQQTQQTLTYDDYKQLQGGPASSQNIINNKSNLTSRQYQTNSSRGGTQIANTTMKSFGKSSNKLHSRKGGDRGDSRDTWINNEGEEEGDDMSSDEIYQENNIRMPLGKVK